MKGNFLNKNDKNKLNKDICPNCSNKIYNLKCDGGGTENYGCNKCGYRYYFGIDWGTTGIDKSIITIYKKL